MQSIKFDTMESISPKSLSATLNLSGYDTSIAQEPPSRQNVFKHIVPPDEIYLASQGVAGKLYTYRKLDDGERASLSMFDDKSILFQYWRPCSGCKSIGEYLDSSYFPVSYRNLVYRWKRLACPILESLRTPIGLLNYNNNRTNFLDKSIG